MTSNGLIIIAEALAILEATIDEHDTAEYAYDEENPWTMREFFGQYERDILAKATSLINSSVAFYDANDSKINFKGDES
jgi:hypothetical protein